MIGESLAFSFSERKVATAASILVIIVFLLLGILLKNRSRFLKSDNGKKCKNLRRKIIIIWISCLFACIWVGGTKRESKFYKEIEQKGRISLLLDGKIHAQKRGKMGNALILSECVFLYEGKREKARDRVIVYGVETEYWMGQRIQVWGEFSLHKKPTNPGEFHSYIYYRARGIYGQIFCDKVEKLYGGYRPILEMTRRIQVNLQKVYMRLFSEEEAGILSAMVLGEKSQLSEEIKTLYQENGISHILAISGLHISFLGANLYRRLRKWHLSFFTSAFFSSIFLFCYGCMVGFSHSALRAILMLCFSFLADVLGRSYDLLSAVSFTAIVVLMLSPYSLFDAGCLLSFFAVFGIGGLLPLLREREKQGEKVEKKLEKKRGWGIKIWESVKSSFLANISIQIMTIPILIHFYYELPVYGIFINLIILPLLSILFPLAIAAVICGSFILEIGRCFAFFASLILRFYKAVAYFFGNLPFSRWTVGEIGVEGYLFYVGIISIIIALNYSQVGKWIQKKIGMIPLRMLCIFLMTALFCFLSFPEKDVKIIMLDVGQGDGIIMKMPDGTSYMIDGGSSSKSKVGEYVLLPALKYYGISQLDYAMVSHEDSDHVSGLIELLERNYPIKNLILPYRETSEKEKNYEKIMELAKKQGTHLIFFKTGDEMRQGKLSISCLHPKERGQEGDVNADSMVLSMQYGEFRAIWTGDLEEGGENALVEELERRDEENYTLLKVAHHGSKKSSFEPFLELVHPKLSLISCSATNRYGHPGRETLERLRKIGSEIYITKDVGAIQLRISQEGEIKLKTFL